MLNGRSIAGMPSADDVLRPGWAAAVVRALGCDPVSGCAVPRSATAKRNRAMQPRGATTKRNHEAQPRKGWANWCKVKACKAMLETVAMPSSAL